MRLSYMACGNSGDGHQPLLPNEAALLSAYHPTRRNVCMGNAGNARKIEATVIPRRFCVAINGESTRHMLGITLRGAMQIAFRKSTGTRPAVKLDAIDSCA